MFPYDLLCADCPRNGSIIVRPSTVWKGPQGPPTWLVGEQTFTLDAPLPARKTILAGTVVALAYPTDGSGTSYTELEGGGNITIDQRSLRLKGTITFPTTFNQQYYIQLSWVWNDGEAYTVGVALFDLVNGCFPDNTVLPCLIPVFQADLCDIDVCSLDCDNTAVIVDGVVVGYFDNTGEFIVTDTDYKNNHSVYGYITADSAYISFAPGVSCDSSVSLVVLGTTYSLDSNAPNGCGYYV